jgi:Na+/proline symporter
MKLNPYSLPNKLYFWFYGVRNFEFIKNGCPWFWKSVLMWLLIVPYVIFCIPCILMEIFSKEYENGDNSTSARVGISIGIYSAGFILACLVTSIFYFFVNFGKNSWQEHFTIFGLFFWFILAVIGIVEGVKALINWRMDRKSEEYWRRIGAGEKPEDINRGSAIVELVKAFYHKYCPQIEWQIKETHKK